ncbi:MAG: DUF4412 domain-containing protein [Lutibacter sp.]|nr:DUF4412 domain-containing protein [Lutibacter sp.]
MKTKFIACVVFLFFINHNIEAQFLKRLKQRVEQKVENTIVEKTSDKAAEKTSNSLDRAFDVNFMGKGNSKVDPSVIPDSYTFSWKYSMKMTTKDGNITFDYFLQPGQPYFGFDMPTMEDKKVMSNMFMVMDNDLKVTIMYMQSDKNSMMMVNGMPDDIDLEEATDKSASYSYEMLPNKTIMGYNCKGVKATNEEYEITMYFTTDAPVSFNDIYKNKKSNIPDGLKNYFKENEQSLMLEMKMIDKKKGKMNATMECVGLSEVQKSINKSDYKTMN